MRILRIVSLAGVFALSAAASVWLLRPESPAPQVQIPQAKTPPASNEAARAEALPTRLPGEAVRAALKLPDRLARTEALLPLIGQLDARALRELWEQLGHGEEEIAPWCRQPVAKRLAELDAPAALELAGQPTDYFVLVKVHEAVLPVLAEKSPELFEPLRDKLQGLPRSAAELVWLGVLLDRDPEQALAFCLRQEETLHRLDSVFRELTLKRGVPKARQLVESLPEKHRQAALTGVALGWAKLEPLVVLGWIETLPAHQRMQIRSAALMAIPPAIGAAYLSTRPGEDRENELRFVVQRWAERDFEAALAWSRTLADPTLRRAAVGGLAQSWAQVDPLAAMMQAAETEPDARNPNNAVEVVATEWAKADPAAFRAWLVRQPAGLARELAVRAYSQVEREVNDDPRSLSVFLLTLSEQSPNEARWLAENVARWAEEDPQGAEAASRALPDARVRASIALKSLEVLSASDPARAAAEMERWQRENTAVLGRPPDTMSNTVRVIADALAKENVPAAARWLAGLPTSRGNEWGLLSVGISWMQRDAPAAVAWLQSLPPEAQRRVWPNILPTVVERDPRQAVAMAQASGDPSLLRAVRDTWLRHDRAAALAWLARDRPDLGPLPAPAPEPDED